MLHSFPLFVHLQSELVPQQALKLTNTLFFLFYHCYDLVDLYILDGFQSVAVISFLHAQIIPSLASGSPFRLAPVPFRHNPSCF